MLQKGLYAIADTGLLTEATLIEKVTLALLGGARVVQYRDKGTERAQRERQAQALQALCQRFSVPLIINDDVDLAACVGAAGVHLGQQDRSVAQARARLGATAIIGVSCYDQIALATAAEQAGATYVALGRFFPSHTKPNAVQARVALLTEAKRCVRVPLVAIGGITPQNAPALVAAGADLLAVIQALFGGSEVCATAQAFTRCFSQSSATIGE